MADEPIDHRALAVSLFNRTWELLDQEKRSVEDDAEMLTVAFASRYHWLQVGDPRNFSVSDWQVSRVAAVLGYVEVSADYAERSLETAAGASLSPFYVAYAHEAVARAAGLAGDHARKQKHLDKAYQLLEEVDQASEHHLLAPDLDELRG